MLIKFTKPNGGSLYLMTGEPNGRPGDGLKRLVDGPSPGESLVIWIENGERLEAAVAGTADENFARLRDEELKAALDYEKAQGRARQGLPSVPVQRGRGAP